MLNHSHVCFLVLKTRLKNKEFSDMTAPTRHYIGDLGDMNSRQKG